MSNGTDMKQAVLSAWPIWVSVRSGGVSITIDNGPVFQGIKDDRPGGIDFGRTVNADRTMRLRMLATDAEGLRADSKITVNNRRMFPTGTPESDPTGALVMIEVSDTMSATAEY